MFSIKLIFLLMACVATFQDTSGSTIPNSRDHYGIIEEIQKALESLKKIIDKVITDAIDTLNKALDTILDLAKGIYLSVSNKLGEMVIEAIKNMNELVGNAENSGVDVSECIVGKNEEIAAIPENLIKESVICVEEKVQKAKRIVNEALNEVKSVLGIIDKLQQDMKKCGTGLESIPCLTKVLANVGLEIIQVPITVTKRVAQAVAYIGTIEAELLQCEANTIINGGLEIGLVIDGVVKCIENKQRESIYKNPFILI